MTKSEEYGTVVHWDGFRQILRGCCMNTGVDERQKCEDNQQFDRKIPNDGDSADRFLGS